ncbi:MAG: twin-arginine translocation signal domain-containing protein [Ardenticatenia bacterium]|nr:twin-arginine translocation signal domain-containing protein [Ardenticatenia bacterium]
MSTDEKEQKRITRREFVKGAAVGAAGVAAAGALASCATPTPVVVKETVEVPVEVTKIVEKIVEVAGPPGEAGPVTLEVLAPTSSIEVTTLFAPRLDTLEGKTICELAMEWQAPRTMPYIREVLKRMYPTAKFIGWEDLPRIGGLDEEGSQLGPVVEAVQAAGCDAVLVGNAG